MGIKCTGINVVSLLKLKLCRVCRTIGHGDLIQDRIWIQAGVKKKTNNFWISLHMIQNNG